MRIEIWSDILCPFCYIGKRRFEQALEQFAHKEEVEIAWRSYQLQPTISSQAGKSVTEHLAEVKGISLEEARQLNAYVTDMAKEVGLSYNLDKAVVANSLDAHRLTHLAAEQGLQDKAEEALFRAYFTQGKDIADRETLVQLGEAIGLEGADVRRMLTSDAYAYAAKQDHQEAENLGARGVPFFVINRKWGVPGAQPSEVFLQALQRAWSAEQPSEENATPAANS